MSESIGALLAGQRRKIKHICEVCGEEFIGIITAKTCSNKCRSKKRYEESKKVDTKT